MYEPVCGDVLDHLKNEFVFLHSFKIIIQFSTYKARPNASLFLISSLIWSSDFRTCHIEGWMRKGFKSCWIKKQIEHCHFIAPVWFHPSIWFETPFVFVMFISCEIECICLNLLKKIYQLIHQENVYAILEELKRRSFHHTAQRSLSISKRLYHCIACIESQK